MLLPPYSVYPKPVSEDLFLRKIDAEDIPQLLPISFYDGKPATTEAEAADMLGRIELDYLKGESIHWGIEEKSTGYLMGTCGYYRGFENASGELGCVLLPEYRGKGYMTEAMRLAVAFGFRIGLKRIFAVTSKDNSAAKNLLARLQFSKIGESEDEVEYELLRESLFSIRPYKPEDRSQVLRLLKLNTPDFFHPSEEKDLEEYLDKEAEHYFVAEGLESILAAGGFNTGFDSGKTVRISWDMVHPEFQGLGIGKALTLFRINEIKKDHNVHKIVVRTTTQAEKFYANTGFQKVHFEKDFWAPGFDLSEMIMNVEDRSFQK